jgi:hypothetical protein
LSSLVRTRSLQKRRKDAKPLAGHDFWIGACCPAGRRREHDVMPVIPHRAPRDAAFRRIEIAVRQRHEQGRHANCPGECGNLREAHRALCSPPAMQQHAGGNHLRRATRWRRRYGVALERTSIRIAPGSTLARRGRCGTSSFDLPPAARGPHAAHVAPPPRRQ